METPRTGLPIFAGEFRHAMDTKNRVTIPARWRRGEVDEFFAIPDLENGFLMMMPPEVMQEVAGRVDADSRLSAQEKRRFIRQFYSRAQHLTTDRQGRLVLPEEYCRQLKLKQEVVLVGGHSRFEVWNPETWKKIFDEEARTFQHVLGMMGV
jgi:transcriptional regulator MraZ